MALRARVFGFAVLRTVEFPMCGGLGFWLCGLVCFRIWARMLRIGVFGAVYWTLIILIIGSLENRNVVIQASI